MHSFTPRNKKQDVHSPNPRTPPWGDRYRGRDLISVRLSLGLRKLTQASRSLQRAWIEVTCVSLGCFRFDRVLITPRPC